jgi:anti-sigma B factor antagonist
MRGEETDMALRAAVAREVTPDGYAEAMLAAAEFRVEVAREGEGVRVCPIGEVDLATIELLRRHMDEAMEAGAARVILDLRRITFLDSSGLHLAVETKERAAGIGAEFAIIPGPPPVQRTFEAAGLCPLLSFVDVPRA